MRLSSFATTAVCKGVVTWERRLAFSKAAYLLAAQQSVVHTVANTPTLLIFIFCFYLLSIYLGWYTLGVCRGCNCSNCRGLDV